MYAGAKELSVLIFCTELDGTQTCSGKKRGDVVSIHPRKPTWKQSFGSMLFLFQGGISGFVFGEILGGYQLQGLIPF